MFLDRFFKPRPAVESGRRLYDVASSQARNPAFYAALGAPDTMEGRFELYTLHVLLLLERLKGEAAVAEARQSLFDAYIQGLDDAFREIGVSDTTIGKKVRKLATHFYGRMKAYDAAFAALPDRAALTALIGRTLFGAEDDSRGGAFAAYVVAVRQGLETQAPESLVGGGGSGMAAGLGMSVWPVKIRFGDAARAGRYPFEADEKAREEIVRLLDLASLERFAGEVSVTPWHDGARLEGRYEAVLEQICGVTAEPLPVSLANHFSLCVLPPGSPHAPDPSAEIEIDPDAEDPPDVLENETIDLTQYAVEHLALDLDPFPRKPGVEFVPPEQEPETNPFSVLANFKPKDGGR